MPTYLRLLFVVGYYVGCAVGELLQVPWPQVVLMARRMLQPGTTKGEEGRTLPIYNGEMFEWLKMAREVRDARYPECGAVSSRGTGQKELQERMGVSLRPRWRAGLLFHDLRRTAVRNMVRAGIPEKISGTIAEFSITAVSPNVHKLLN